jgi:hypothetical protein
MRLPDRRRTVVFGGGGEGNVVQERDEGTW